MDSALQFDKAEFASPNGSSSLNCGGCNSEIADSYYTANGVMMCAGCSDKISHLLAGGSGSSVLRFMRALLFGVVTATVGAAIYYAVLAGTGYQFGLIAIIVGILVGKAVHKGSHGRGGWRYQCLAMFLTYLAIASTYVPIVIKAARERQHREAQAEFKRVMKAEHMTGYAEEDSPPIAEPASQRLVANRTVTPVSQPGERSALRQFFGTLTQARDQSTGLTRTAIALFAMLLGTLILPILVGMNSPITLLIVGFGVFEAWKINKRAEIEVTGPHEIIPWQRAAVDAA